MYLLTKKEIISELKIYNKKIKNSFFNEVTIICISVALMMLNLLLLILGAIFKMPLVAYIIFATFLAILIITFGVFSVFWYSKSKNDSHSHLPIVPKNFAINVSGTIINVMNYLCAIFSLVIDNIDGFTLEKHETIIFLTQSTIVFIFWSIILPILAVRLRNFDFFAYIRYLHFEVSKIPAYVKLLKSLYKKRIGEFNEELKAFLDTKSDEWKKLNSKNPRWKYVEKNSEMTFDTRRVFNGYVHDGVNIYDMIRFIAFADIFEYVYRYKKWDKDIALDFKLFFALKDGDVAKKFYKAIKTVVYNACDNRMPSFKKTIKNGKYFQEKFEKSKIKKVNKTNKKVNNN